MQRLLRMQSTTQPRVQQEVKMSEGNGSPTKLYPTGGSTMFDILEGRAASRSSVGAPFDRSVQEGSPAAAVIEEKNKEILAKAVSPDAFERALTRKASQPSTSSQVKFKRGMVVRHVPTNKRVTIMATGVDTDYKGEIRHHVCVVGTDKKYKVPESALEVIPNGRH